ncbi:Hypp7201 [Branchiostoma lanceolatum]|uniref:Hypp7201 protein n=1 Tax=Branchiostoma lanceolatum TaxID=7740 RepID=A0A8J9YYA2_BRALA|nr:Hypp7201 [Branchiostoma lanceolatum]
MSCRQRMRSEFRLKSFGLTHNDRHVFTRTPWLKNQLPFVLYRVAACLYQVVIFFAVPGATGQLRPLLLVFLTQWAFIILTLHTVVSAALCFADYYNSRSQRGASDDNHLSSDVVMETGSTIQLTTTGSRRGETNWLSNQLPFVLYRVAACLYQMTAFFTMHTIPPHRFSPVLLIFLTEWGYILLTLHTMVSAALCFADYYNSRSPVSEVAMATENTRLLTATDNGTTETNVGQDYSQTPPLPWYYKLHWVLYNRRGTLIVPSKVVKMTCRQRMRSEFRLKSFGLTHKDHQVFTRTPWLTNQLPFVLYRVAACLYQVIAFSTILALVSKFPRELLLAYLTIWGYILLTLHTVVSAALCCADYYNSRSQRRASDDSPLSSDVVMKTECTIPLTTTDSGTAQASVVQDSVQLLPLPWYSKLCWVLYNLAFCLGIGITILFWALPRNDYSALGILIHAVNSVTIVIDVVVSGLPCRLLHFVYPLTFGFFYIIFTVVYWAAGGRGLYDSPFIYSVLDYGGNPTLAAIVAVLGVLVAVPVCHCIVFALVVARESLIRLLQRRNVSNSHGDNIAAS